MLLKNGVHNIYGLVLILYVTHPLEIGSRNLDAILGDILAAAVEAETKGAGILSVNFSWDLEHFLEEFWQIVLFKDPVNALENGFK